MAPAAQSAAPATPQSAVQSNPQPGTWKHPRFDEIARRQNATTFSEANVKQIAYNVGGVIAMSGIDLLLQAYLPSINSVTKSLQPYSSYAWNLIRVIFIYNIISALLPLVRRKDDLSDIPLTPAQRKLLGLPAVQSPPTPGSNYITPPRFQRSTTPQSGSPRSTYSASPTSAKDSANAQRSGSPFSPNASPLLHKAMGGMNARRTSYGSPSPLGPGSQKPWLDAASPSNGKGASVGLNSKWLYEKGRNSPGSSGIFA